MGGVDLFRHNVEIEEAEADHGGCDDILLVRWKPLHGRDGRIERLGHTGSPVVSGSFRQAGTGTEVGFSPVASGLPGDPTLRAPGLHGSASGTSTRPARSACTSR